jgi:hypothetical protein
MNSHSLHHLKINGIDCYGLNEHDRQRIEQIGYWNWLDEQAAEKPGPRRRRPSRRIKDAIWAGFRTMQEGSDQQILAT